MRLAHGILRAMAQDSDFFDAVLQEEEPDCLLIDAYNTAEVVITMENGDEHSGLDEEVYIMDKKAP